MRTLDVIRINIVVIAYRYITLGTQDKMAFYIIKLTTISPWCCLIHSKLSHVLEVGGFCSLFVPLWDLAV